MASKSISKASSTLQNETSTSQMVEPTFRRPSPIQISTSLPSGPSTPKRLPNSEVLDGAKPITHQKGPTDSLPNKIPTKTNSLDQKIIQQGPGAELLQLTESLSLEKVTEDQEKKNSEQGSGKNSRASTKVSDDTSSVTKTNESAKISDRADFVESGKSSMCRASTCSDVSDESTSSTISSSVNKPHKANDSRWEAIQSIRAKDGVLGFSHFRLLKRLGCGDIGSVYLFELNGTKSYFAMKVMDKVALASRKKLLRAQTEKEILQCLDHPFLPTLYTHFETEKFSCLVMEFCPGGDLHTLRQRQPGKYFSEHAVKYGTRSL